MIVIVKIDKAPNKHLATYITPDYGTLPFGGLPACCFVLARRWASDAQWKGWAAYSIVTGVLMVASFVAFVIVGVLDGPAGLIERITISIGLAWIVLLAIRPLSKNTGSR